MIKNRVLIDKTKTHFLNLYKESGQTAPYPEHVAAVEKLASEMVMDFPEVDTNVLLLSVWLHDIGAFLGERDLHDINSEKETRVFLAELGLNIEMIDKIAHCVRAHRCNDVKPETIEAKILAVADSASHMVAGPYLDMKEKYGKEYVVGKLERDYRDIGLLPNIKDKFTPIYDAWKLLLEVLPE